MRRIALLFTCVAMMQSVYAAKDEYSVGIIVDAGQDREISAGFFRGIQNNNENLITVELDGMVITASYETMFASGRNAASNFIVGSEVEARVHKDKWLYVLREDGKPLKARITRRAIADSD